jgi:hypothetical protein
MKKFMVFLFITMFLVSQSPSIKSSAVTLGKPCKKIGRAHFLGPEVDSGKGSRGRLHIRGDTEKNTDLRSRSGKIWRSTDILQE